MNAQWSTFSEIAEVSAAAMRVLVLENADSGVDLAAPFVRTRIEDAVRVLEECAVRLAALEDFFLRVGEAGSTTFDSLAECSAAACEDDE